MTAARKKRPRSRRLPAAPNNDRRAETVIVLWMLAAVATLLAMIVMLGLRIVLAQVDDPPSALNVMPNLMLLVGCVTGSITMGFTPLALKWSQRPPPQVIAVLAMLIGVTPWLTVAVVWLAG